MCRGFGGEGISEMWIAIGTGDEIGYVAKDAKKWEVANELVLTYLPWLEDRLESERLGVYYNRTNISSRAGYTYSSDRCQMSWPVPGILPAREHGYPSFCVSFGLHLSKMRPEDRLYCRCGVALFRADRCCLTFLDSFFIA